MVSLGNRIETSLRSLVRRLRNSPGAEGMTLVSNEAALKAHQTEDGRVALTSLLDGQRLFCVRGTLDAALTRVEGDRGTVLRLPIRNGEGDRHWVGVRVLHSAAGDPPQALRRVRAVALPEGLEFHFRADSAPDSTEVVLEFAVPSELQVTDFRPFEDLQPLFRELPGVHEMASYLRACMHHRRSQLQILADLAEILRSARIQDAVDLMRRRRMAILFHTEPLLRLSERLAARRIEMSPTILGLACLAAELEGRTLGLEDLAQQLDDAVPYEPTLDLLERFEDILTDRERGSAAADSETSPRNRALVRAAQALVQDSALRILADLASQSRAGTAGSLVRLLRRDLRDASVLADRSQLALRRLLARRGRNISRGTMAGLCLFVEAELGLLTWEQMEALVRSGERPATSAYTLAAVGGACDLELRGFELSPEHVADLLRVTEGQALIQSERDFLTPDEAPPSRDRTCVLAHLPILDNLHPQDQAVLARAGRRLFSCYRAQEGRRVFWADHSEAGGTFAGRALGHLRAVPSAELQGRQGVVTAWADLRGQVSFRYHEEFPVAGIVADPAGPRWTGEVVELPEVGDLPSVLQEMGRHDLSTLHDHPQIPETLAELQQALEGLGHETIDSLHAHPRLLSFVRLGLVSPSLVRLMCEAADRNTRQAILEAARRPDGVREELLAHPSLLAMLDMAETAETGLLAAAVSLAPRAEVHHLAAVLFTMLRRHVNSQQSTVRWVVARMLGTTLGTVALEDSVGILGALRQDPGRTTALAATASLAALELATIRPLPPLVEVRAVPASQREQGTGEAERLALQVTDHVRSYLLFPRDESPGTRFLVRDDPPLPRPYRTRIEALCRLVAGLNAAMQADPRAGRLEIRPALAAAEPQRFAVPDAGPAGPWTVSAEGAAMADRTGFSPFFDHLCRVADHLPLEEVEVLRHGEDGEMEVFDPSRRLFRSVSECQPCLPGGPESLKAAARRLVARLALAQDLEEPVARMLQVHWRDLTRNRLG